MSLKISRLSLLVMFLVVFLYLSSPSSARAQTNEFKCMVRNEECVVDQENSHCDPGFRIEERACHAIDISSGNITECLQARFGCFVNEQSITCSKGGQLGISTAIGCIPIYDQNPYLIFLIKWATGLAGGIALILIVYGTIIIITSQGDPRKFNAGKELLISAIAGLIFLVISIYLLRIIGVNILQLPQFGT
jgi:hypothetical protein